MQKSGVLKEALDIKLIIGPGDKKAREYFYNLTEGNDLFNIRNNTLSEKWNSIYKKRILDYNESSNISSSLILKKLDNDFQDFCKNDLFKIENFFYELNTNFWTFFCNPKNWKIDKFLEDINEGNRSEIDTWRIRDSDVDKIKIGDYGIIRVGVDNRNKAELESRKKIKPGIYAIVKIIDSPRENTDQSEIYWNNDTVKKKRKLSVKIEFVKNLIQNPIIFAQFQNDISLLDDPYMVKGFRASSMPLTKKTFSRILEILDFERETIDVKDYYLQVIENYNKDINKITKTEKENIVKTRIYQSKFRKNLLSYKKYCTICKLDIEDLLIASHIKPWKDATNFERINFFNGFLLCPTHDKLFDNGFISFNNNGEIIISEYVSPQYYSKLNIDNKIRIEVLDGHKKFLKWHREKVFKNNDKF